MSTSIDAHPSACHRSQRFIHATRTASSIPYGTGVHTFTNVHDTTAAVET